MGKRRTGRKKSGMKIPDINISNRTLKIIVGVLVLVCLLAGGVYVDTFHGKGLLKEMFSKDTLATPSEAESNATMESMAVDISSKATTAVFGNEFLLCTKDGVKYFTSMGDAKWSDTFNMTSPVMTQEGDYVAVGDMGGKTVRVYDRNGMLYDLQAEGSPVQFGLNESGYLSLITRNEKTYRVRVYNTKGTLLKERVEESNGVYPLCSDVSDDSKVFAVSYLDTTDISPISRVVLFYIDAEESENHTDSMFAAVEKTDEIIPVIGYMEDGVLSAVSDVGVYGIGSDGTELWNYPLDNTIDQAALNMKKYLVLALGDSVANKDGREKGTVCWLDSNGKEKASFAAGDSVTYLHSAEKGVVIGNDRRYTGVSHSGNENWTYTATGDLSDLPPMGKLNMVMTVAKEQVSIFDMSKPQ
ncbi:MAG: hypothetical protein II313_01350, partial [Anaerotignum sp.]|nr:hypothetical protein [Anaerotignum sp.]